MVTIFTPIEYLKDLLPKKDQTSREYLNVLLDVSQKLRVFPTILDPEDGDYEEIVSLIHKHNVPAAIKIICDFDSMSDALNSDNAVLSTDGKDTLVVKLRLLHFLHNLCRHIQPHADRFDDKTQEFGGVFREIWDPATVNVYLRLEGVTRFNDEIFSKLASAFTAVLWIQYQMNPLFQEQISVSIRDSDGRQSLDVELWSIIFDHYEQFHVDNIEYLGNILERAIETDPNFLGLYDKFSNKTLKLSVVFFLQDYIEKHISGDLFDDPYGFVHTINMFLVLSLQLGVKEFKLCDPQNILQNPDSKLQISLVATMIKCLSMIITKEGVRNFFKDVSLLRIVIDLGLHIKSLESIDPENFKPINKIKDRELATNPGRVLEQDPTFGLKTGIVKLIANLVDEHPANQDLVRESDGLAFILDCSQIDDRNSFIQQWAIFAINNVLKNNSANQEFVSDMRKKMNENPMTQ